jgi:hypothetical protein
MTLSREIKKFLNSNGVKNSVTTHHSTITVVVKSHITTELRDAVKNMETVEAHGSIYDDTRWYTGTSIQFRYEFEPTQDEINKAQELFNSWSDNAKEDKRSFQYHFTKQLDSELGVSGQVIAEKIYKMY